MTSAQGIYHQTYFFPPSPFDEVMDISPSSPEDPELVPILDREDNSDLSRPDSSISSYSSRSSSDSLCVLDDVPFLYSQTPQKYQLPRAPPPTPLLTSPLVSPLKHGLDDRDLYSAPFVLRASLLELGQSLGDLFSQTEGEYRDMGESSYIPFQHKRKQLSESWSLPCSFNEPTNYPLPNVEGYNDDYSLRLRASLDEGLFMARELPSVNPVTRASPPTPPPSRCSLEESEEGRPWLMSEIEEQLHTLAYERTRAEKSQEQQGQDELAEIERPARRLHRGAIKKFSRAWKEYLHRS